MQTVFLALFIAVSVIHLYGSYIDNKRVRNATKGAILLCLLGYYLSSAQTIDWGFTGALIFSFLGDVLLMFQGGFIVGGVCFALAQFCLIAAYVPHIQFETAALYMLLAALVYGAAVVLEFRALGGHVGKKLFPAMVFYLLSNAAMNVCALGWLLSAPGRGPALVFAGAALFFLSDCTLFFVRFHRTRPVWHKHFPVMLTYIAGELLITLGILAAAG